MSETILERYSVITDKNPREIVLLRGSGCVWKKCTFCDYYLDSDNNEESNYNLNSQVLDRVSGVFHHLEVINSGSFFELGERTINRIIEICQEKGISKLHFESHWIFRNRIAAMKERFNNAGITLKIKIGVETFDYDYRENVLMKGIDEKDPSVISTDFDEVCLLQGLTGQTVESMKSDIEIGLKYFERVCVNIMNENTTDVKPDNNVIHKFLNDVYPLYKENDRIDILLNNTDFGVGGNNNA